MVNIVSDVDSLVKVSNITTDNALTPQTIGYFKCLAGQPIRIKKWLGRPSDYYNPSYGGTAEFFPIPA